MSKVLLGPILGLHEKLNYLNIIHRPSINKLRAITSTSDNSQYLCGSPLHDRPHCGSCLVRQTDGRTPHRAISATVRPSTVG